MSVLLRFRASIDKPLLKASGDDLLAWLDGLRIAARTRHTYISHLHAFYVWAIREELTKYDPTVRLTRPKVRPGLPRPMAHEDIETLIELATPEMSAMIHLGAFAGLRCMEIAGLDASDVLFTAEPPVVVVINGKGGRHRVIPMAPRLVAALRLHGIPNAGPVFRRDDGSRLEPWRVSRRVRNHMASCGVKGTAHQLRHSFGTAVYRSSGGDLRMTQELLGHASPSTTAIYTAWSQERAGKVVQELYAS